MTGLPQLLHLPRRALFRLGAGLGLGSAAGILASPAISKALEGYRPQNLTDRELHALTALMSRLVPADLEHGGAVEAGAFVYVDRALGGYHSAHLQAYRESLAELDRQAQKLGHAGFALLDEDQMDQLISRLEAGELSDRLPGGGKAFFGLARRHTLEGYLSDPMYGGNRDFIGWEALGYNGVQLYYGVEAQRLNGSDEREQRSIADFGGSPMP